MKTLGIAVHSAEGGALCFLTACRAGGVALGTHMHPTVVLSAIPMGLSMDGWRGGDLDAVAEHLGRGVRQVADAGADFFVCPDNTAHIVLERIAADLPIPGLHIAEVAAAEIARHGWKRVGLLGTEWTMTGPVYPRALEARGVELLVPEAAVRERIDTAIFDELCPGIFEPATTDVFVRAIEELKSRGAECVILGCTEIPLIIDAANSALPVIDTTRLLARYAILEAVSDEPLPPGAAWLAPRAEAAGSALSDAASSSGEPIRWRLHLDAPPEAVFRVLDSDDGRASFWAESAVEADGVIDFRFANGARCASRILEREPPRRLSLDYFDSVATFDLAPDGRGGTDLTVTNRGVAASEWNEVHAGWLNVLLPLKAAVSFGVDLRNHDPERTWERGFVDQ